MTEQKTKAAAEPPLDCRVGRGNPLIPEFERLRRDAERYRWLRARIPGGTYRIMGVIYSEGGEGVDAAIDAAMAVPNAKVSEGENGK